MTNGGVGCQPRSRAAAAFAGVELPPSLHEGCSIDASVEPSQPESVATLLAPTAAEFSVMCERYALTSTRMIESLSHASKLRALSWCGDVDCIGSRNHAKWASVLSPTAAADGDETVN